MVEDINYSQEGPRLGNQYLEDSALISYLGSFMQDGLTQYSEELTRFGKRVVTDIYENHLLCEKFPPVFEQFDAWGRRIDKIYTNPAWGFMQKVSAEESLIKHGYSNINHHRLLQFAKLYLFSPSSGLFLCPLAMTDGAAYLSRELLKAKEDPELREAYTKLTSNNPDEFWTCGQWMTEKHGGSDVSNGTMTYAVIENGDYYKLYGYKWFTSATTANASFALARVDGKLSLLYLKLRNEAGDLNGIKIVRLKDKMGTKQLPTAEMILDGCRAKLVSPVGQGVKYIAHLINITRLYNSIGAVASMRRSIAISRDYAYRRMAFKKPVIEYPLHQSTLSEMELSFRGCLILTIYAWNLLEKIEKNTAKSWEKATLRLITPVVKLYTAKKAVEIASEAIECIGGVGYMENSNIASILRDSQVYAIWEGTTNVLSLDVLRGIATLKDPNLSYFKKTLEDLGASHLVGRLENVLPLLNQQHLSRKIAWEIGNVMILALLSWQAQKTNCPCDREIYEQWEAANQQNLRGVNPELAKKLATDSVNRGQYAGKDADNNGEPRTRI